MNSIVSSRSIPILLVLCACSTTAKVSTIPGMGVSMPLARADYTILGVATGEACATQSCFLGNCDTKADIGGEELLDGRAESASLRQVDTGRTDALYWLTHNSPLAFIFGGGERTSGSEVAEKIALYKAIESIPNADAIIQPRKQIDINKSDILGISTTTKSCVKVLGKAIHVKSDAEMAKK